MAVLPVLQRYSKQTLEIFAQATLAQAECAEIYTAMKILFKSAVFVSFASCVMLQNANIHSKIALTLERK